MNTNTTAISPTTGSNEAGRFVGFTVSWDFPKGTVKFCHPRSEVAAAFDAHGFGEYMPPDNWDAGTALLHIYRTGGGRLIKIEPMERPNKDTPAAMAFYKKLAGSEATGDDFSCGARVRVQGDRCIALALEGQATADADCYALAERFADEANRTITHVGIKELALVLGRVGRSTLWAPYRDHGGTWFVYASEVAERFKSLLIALKALSGATDKHDPTRTRHGFKPRVQPLFIDIDGLTEANVRESSEDALEKELNDIIAKLDKVKTKGMRQHSIARALDDCDELLQRAEFYRCIMQDAADAIGDRIGGVRKALAGHIEEKPAPKARKRKAPSMARAVSNRSSSASDDPFALFAI